MLLAVPCARDPVEVMTQGHNLRTGFINYLQQKHAAGIVNIQDPGSSQVRPSSLVTLFMFSSTLFLFVCYAPAP